MAQGAPLQKPAKPTTQALDRRRQGHLGHLPAELRQEIENMFNEQPLSTKEELISATISPSARASSCERSDAMNGRRRGAGSRIAAS